MLIDCLYQYRKCEGLKSGFTLEAYTGYYQPLHSNVFKAGKMSGQVGLYKSNPNVNAISSRQPSYTLSGVASARISGIFFTDVDNPSHGFGDVQGTADLLLVVDRWESLTLLVLKGRKTVSRDLIQPWLDGEFQEEVSALESRAIKPGELVG